MAPRAARRAGRGRRRRVPTAPGHRQPPRQRTLPHAAGDDGHGLPRRTTPARSRSASSTTARASRPRCCRTSSSGSRAARARASAAPAAPGSAWPSSRRSSRRTAAPCTSRAGRAERPSRSGCPRVSIRPQQALSPPSQQAHGAHALWRHEHTRPSRQGRRPTPDQCPPLRTRRRRRRRLARSRRRRPRVQHLDGGVGVVDGQLGLDVELVRLVRPELRLRLGPARVGQQQQWLGGDVGRVLR